MLLIRSAEPLDDYWVRLTLTDGSKVERNVRRLLRGPVFEPLRSDYGRFRRIRVRGGTIEWPGQLDLDPQVVIWNGSRPRDPDARPAIRLELTHPSESVGAR